MSRLKLCAIRFYIIIPNNNKTPHRRPRGDVFGKVSVSVGDAKFSVRQLEPETQLRDYNVVIEGFGLLPTITRRTLLWVVGVRLEVIKIDKGGRREPEWSANTRRTSRGLWVHAPNAMGIGSLRVVPSCVGTREVTRCIRMSESFATNSRRPLPVRMRQ